MIRKKYAKRVSLSFGLGGDNIDVGIITSMMILTMVTVSAYPLAYCGACRPPALLYGDIHPKSGPSTSVSQQCEYTANKGDMTWQMWSTNRKAEGGSLEEHPSGMLGVGQAFLELAASSEGGDTDLKSAGQALVRAGQAWTVDWSDVTCALEEASQALQQVASSNSNLEWTEIADELYDASSIEGCTSIGPLAISPNLERIQELLMDLCQHCSDESDDQRKELYDRASKALETILE
jgi:hypothetical protein